MKRDNISVHVKLNRDIICGSVLMLCRKTGQILSTPAVKIQLTRSRCVFIETQCRRRNSQCRQLFARPGRPGFQAYRNPIQRGQIKSYCLQQCPLAVVRFGIFPPLLSFVRDDRNSKNTYSSNIFHKKLLLSIEQERSAR